MPSPNFAVVVISRNEAETLPRLVASLSEFQKRGGNIFVCDTGSTDGTPEIARGLGCKVTEVGDNFRHTLSLDMVRRINSRFVAGKEEPLVQTGDSLFDFSSARNFAASLADKDFIFMPDCDEVFKAFDIDAIEKALADRMEQAEYNFTFSFDTFGNEAIKFMHSKAYDRRKLKWTGIIHEILSGEAKRVFFPEDKIKLAHYQNEKTNRGGYLKGLALDCFENPGNDRNSHYLGRELLYTGRPRSAIKELARHVAMNKWPAERSQSMIFIGDAYMQLGEEKVALERYHEAFTIEPGRREPFIRLAEHYFRKNDHQRTACFAEAALAIPESNFYANNAEHYRHVPHELLSWAYWYMGKKDEARNHFDQAFEFQPENPKFLHDYRFYHSLPTINVVIPHLSLGNPEREKGLERCLASIKSQNYPQELIKVQVLDGEGTVPEKVQQMVSASTGEFIVYAANDVEFEPNAFILAYLDSYYHYADLVSFNEGEVLPDEGNINAHFMVKRKFIDLIGEVFDTHYHHCCVDNLLWAKAKKFGIAFHSERAKLTHHHFSKGAEYDAVYQKGWAHVEEDRKRLTQDLKALMLK